MKNLQFLNLHVMIVVSEALKPRKTSVQARSAATIEALHIAAIQVLTRDGLIRCTTTRIAERAGMSVGSLYQYYPNRDAILAAVLEKHLVGLADTIDRICLGGRGQPVSEMASRLVTTFLAIKLRDPAESKALYAVAGERGGAELVMRVNARMVASITAMLASAPDAHFEDTATAAAVSLSAIVGTVRAVLEGYAPAGFEADLEGQTILLVTAYLKALPRRQQPLSQPETA